MKILTCRQLLSSLLLLLSSLARGALAELAQQQVSNQTSQPNYLETGRQITGILDRFMSLGYDKRVRPNYGGPPVSVNVTMRILSISSVSEVMMDFTADFYFRQTWHDPRLSFKKLGDIQTLYVGAEVSKKIWLPDTFFGNEKLAYFHEATTPNVFLRIDHSGEVYRSIRLTVTSSCPMNLQYFPMDKQRCTIEAESYGYNIKDIIYRWARRDSAVERDKEISLPQFDIVKTVQKYRLEELSSGTYSRLIAEIHFARRMGYYLIQIYIPSSLIVVISWVSFWLHRNASPARVQLGVTTVLTMTTLMSSTNAALPKISYVKSIDIFLGTCFLMVFAALLEYATVGYLGKRIAMRKAQAQHSQPQQAQARLFAQLQAQGAQGDPVPPTTASALLATPPLGGGGIGKRLPEQLHEATHLGNLFEATNQVPPSPPQRNHLQCHCATAPIFGHHEEPQSTGCHHKQQLCCQPLNKQARRNNHQTTCQCNNSNHHHHHHHHHHHQQQQQHHEQEQEHTVGQQHRSLPRNVDSLVAAGALELAAADKQLQAMHLASSGSPNAGGGAVFRDHQVGAAAAESGLNLNLNLNLADTCLPPSYGSKGAAAAATAAAATFVNLHRRKQGLPPSTNPHFAQFAWLGKQDSNLETIFGIRPSDIDKYSRVVFPVCFVCFQLMYWIVYLHISAFLDSEQQQQQQQ